MCQYLRPLKPILPMPKMVLSLKEHNFVFVLVFFRFYCIRSCTTEKIISFVSVNMLLTWEYIPESLQLLLWILDVWSLDAFGNCF